MQLSGSWATSDSRARQNLRCSCPGLGPQARHGHGETCDAVVPVLGHRRFTGTAKPAMQLSGSWAT
eukprot:4110974-Lingulodinium_polyedra.AAC.1